MKNKYRSLKADAQYLRLVVANVISTFGTSMDNIAFAWLVYQITQDAVWVAIIFGVSYLPMIFLSPILGVLVEKMSKKKVLIASDISGCVITAGMFVLFLCNVLNPWLLLLFTFINACIEAIRIPAGIAIVPHVLSEENYDVGLSLNSGLTRIAELLGLSITGFIIALFGIQVALIVDSLTYLLSFLIIASLKIKEKVERLTKQDLQYTTFMHSFKEGVSYLMKHEAIKFICAFGTVSNFIALGLATYQVVYVEEALHMGADVFSMMSLAFSLGMILGSFITPKVSAKWSTISTFICGGALFGLYYISLFYIPMLQVYILRLTCVILATFLAGIVGGLQSVAISIYFMKVVAQEYLARVGSVFNSLVSLAMPLASLTLAILIMYINVSEIMLCFGILNICLCMLFYIIYKKKKIEE